MTCVADDRGVCLYLVATGVLSTASELLHNLDDIARDHNTERQPGVTRGGGSDTATVRKRAACLHPSCRVAGRGGDCNSMISGSSQDVLKVGTALGGSWKNHTTGSDSRKRSSGHDVMTQSCIAYRMSDALASVDAFDIV